MFLSVLESLCQGSGGSSRQSDRFPALPREDRRHCGRRPFVILLLLWRHQFQSNFALQFHTKGSYPLKKKTVKKGTLSPFGDLPP